MNDYEEEVRVKDFELLKELAGEEVAKKYASKENYEIKSVGFVILKYSVINFAKQKPFDLFIYAAILLITINRLYILCN